MSVCIVGWSHTPFGRLDLDFEQLVTTATSDAISHAGIDAAAIDGVWLGHLNGGLIPEIFCSSLPSQGNPGLRWKPATRVENACASGAAAIASACDAIEAGRARIALVVGAEKMTAVSGQMVTDILARASYYRDEGAHGLTFPGIFAKLVDAYGRQYGDPSDAMARIAAKNHANGTRNPYAHMRKDVGFDFCNTVSAANPLIHPGLRKTDCSLVSDGAAALILVDAALAKDFDRAIAFRARAHVNDLLPIAKRNILGFEGPRRAWTQALSAARCSVRDLSFAEIHDCFTIAELLTYEAMGLTEPGRGSRALLDGTVYPDGALPINASGGLKAKGHPIGATGVSMHVLAAMQLTGSAGEMQITGANLGAVFNMGGMAVANYVNILEHVQ
ncbi:MAG TPA: acetyl-CoA acetyltransferase [Aromatoleum sp.]|uniref:acetyl-CoA acetyltransferase n=1 Tax=Aromatoleum sp. TaxID=2307007 RepID=UPI002B46A5F4|nr:acetyl-CoA acetyltransferase [Aromatoleum sp.]HJV28740.1 acetyl-CoA acetyltransferase [Aromatoleum sp.]